MKTTLALICLLVSLNAMSQLTSKDSLTLSSIQQISKQKRISNLFGIIDSSSMSQDMKNSSMFIRCDSNGILPYPQSRIIVFGDIFLCNVMQLFFYNQYSYMVVKEVTVSKNRIELTFSIVDPQRNVSRFRARVNTKNFRIIRLKQIKHADE